MNIDSTSAPDTKPEHDLEQERRDRFYQDTITAAANALADADHTTYADALRARSLVAALVLAAARSEDEREFARGAVSVLLQEIAGARPITYAASSPATAIKTTRTLA